MRSIFSSGAKVFKVLAFSALAMILARLSLFYFFCLQMGYSLRRRRCLPTTDLCQKR